jgi:RNA methyltransferase, TrmH family
MTPLVVTSRDNAWVKLLRQLAQETGAYRKLGKVWIEGDHLCRAALARGRLPQAVVYTPKAQAMVASWALPGEVKAVQLTDALMQAVSGLESAASVGFVMDLEPLQTLLPSTTTVVLDRLQDPGNAGSILRTAAAMGFGQVLAMKGSVGLWSTKVVRSGMGAHFALHIVEGLDEAALSTLQVPLLATSSHQGDWVHLAKLPWPCAWVLGHEGQGVSPTLMAQAQQTVRIAQPGGEESLNVAAAAAICLHASAVSSGL